MEDKLDIIIHKLILIEQRLERIENSTTNMDNHISFVEYIIKKINFPSLQLSKIFYYLQ